MSVPLVTEVESVEVGRFYLVPCVYMPPDGSRSLTGWAPIIGPRHSDEETIKFPDEHYHYDFRFVTAAQMSKILGLREPAIAPAVVLDSKYVKDTRWRRRMCRHAGPPEWPYQRSPWMAALEDAYASHRLKPDCRVCPHRGLPLNGQPVRLRLPSGGMYTHGTR